MTLPELYERLRKAWSLETSATPDEWRPNNAARGQCAITALVVQDIMGGELMRTTVGGESHYYNMLPDGSGSVDLTLQQFGDQPHDVPGEPRTRQYILSFPSTRKRYAKLLERLWA